MSFPEFKSWIRYAKKNGPINQAKKLDVTLAYIALNFASVMYKKKAGEQFTISDFSLWLHEQDQEEYGSVDDALNLLKQVSAGSNDGK